MNKSYLFCFILLSLFCFISCGETKVENTLSPEASSIISSLEANAPKVSDKIADEATITKRREMLGEVLSDNDFKSDTLIIVECFRKGPIGVYQVDIFNTKDWAVASYKSEQKRTTGRKKVLIPGEYELQAIEPSSDTADLVRSVLDNGISVINQNKTKLSGMMRSIKAESTIVSLLIKDGNSYKVESEEK